MGKYELSSVASIFSAFHIKLIFGVQRLVGTGINQGQECRNKRLINRPSKRYKDIPVREQNCKLFHTYLAPHPRPVSGSKYS